MKTKELTIEEKAKAYDEALKVLHKYDGAHIMFTQDLKEEMFPELREASEDERIWKALIEEFKKKLERGFEWKEGIPNNAVIAWLEKKGGQKPAEWSEEDEEHLNSIIGDIKTDMGAYSRSKEVIDIYNDDISFLKSLKERVQPKQEWSKEDEREVDVLKAYICSREWSDSHIDRALGIVDELVKKLKSLRPQSTWKPSEEQMEGIECTIKTLKYQLNAGDNRLESLYQDLKKLREEKL